HMPYMGCAAHQSPSSPLYSRTVQPNSNSRGEGGPVHAIGTAASAQCKASAAYGSSGSGAGGGPPGTSRGTLQGLRAGDGSFLTSVSNASALQKDEVVAVARGETALGAVQAG
ncbi:hypothetical protein Vretifemale_11600, partial [Volvox reticuliferus]